jgi:hypothetical protein
MDVVISRGRDLLAGEISLIRAPLSFTASPAAYGLWRVGATLSTDLATLFTAAETLL